jgi:hypothetical protein
MNHEDFITPGVYSHYKGKKYEVIGVGRHTETSEELVVYRPLYESDVGYWVRPLAMFNEQVTINGESVSRFQKANEND